MRKWQVIVVLIAFCWSCLAQDSGKADSYSSDYENHNQVDYGPLKLSIVQGKGSIRIKTQNEGSARDAWYGLFNERDHKLLSSVRADSHGHFSFQNIPPGRYRLVAKAQGLCSANVPLKVVKHSFSHKDYLLIHFIPAATDTCSYGELARKPAL